MFDNRCMYYLTIVVVMLFSVSFIKLNKFWELDVRYGEVESEKGNPLIFISQVCE